MRTSRHDVQEPDSAFLMPSPMVNHHLQSLDGCVRLGTAPPHKHDPNPGTSGLQQGSSPTLAVTATSLVLIDVPTDHLTRS